MRLSSLAAAACLLVGCSAPPPAAETVDPRYVFTQEEATIEEALPRKWVFEFVPPNGHYQINWFSNAIHDCELQVFHFNQFGEKDKYPTADHTVPGGGTKQIGICGQDGQEVRVEVTPGGDWWFTVTSIDCDFPDADAYERPATTAD